ncbi:uncharacterized protein PV09_03918 [Verruconis gallopava]|uniref:Gelsolin-like domain-containing protein n=1 Tax=Verruconis gallopava TaxID=253628 RepID=A0A0D2AFX6_9PEZI|nr:uncharacterized protein PV09_03918 [Verruconis gallopava]KIW05405.1 hypothetical protein PV09_03918 [Verruconis gallopava]
MPPHEGLVHLEEYDLKDSNVELIGSDLDHKVKYNSAASEPAWNNGVVGREPGLFVWRVEDFQVIPLPGDQHGQFYDGDSYVVLRSAQVRKAGHARLVHEIFFWLGSKTSQDEAGTAAYKAVELDEFLGGAAVQHRELQAHMSDDFVALFPRIVVRRGGVRSGFRHVEQEKEPKRVTTLLRIFKHPSAKPSDSLMVVEVEPRASSLDEHDVFVLDKGDKIWVWQGRHASPMEKAKAAQVVSDLTLAKHVDVEVVSQAEPRSKIVLDQLRSGENNDDDGDGDGEGEGDAPRRSARPVSAEEAARQPRLLRISDAGGRLALDVVKSGAATLRDLRSDDVFLFDTGKVVWVWEGSGASRQEKAMWIEVAQAYIRRLQQETGASHLVPVAKVTEGNESPAFLEALEN